MDRLGLMWASPGVPRARAEHSEPLGWVRVGCTRGIGPLWHCGSPGPGHKLEDLGKGGTGGPVGPAVGPLGTMWASPGVPRACAERSEPLG